LHFLPKLKMFWLHDLLPSFWIGLGAHRTSILGSNFHLANQGNPIVWGLSPVSCHTKQNQMLHEIACDRSREEQRVNELLECIRTELSSIPTEQAESFWLCCVEGLKYREAAEVMGLETQYVGVLVLRARKHLSSALTQWDRETFDLKAA
jgi:predicted DNA-binding protein (UPF0251 family)